MSAPSDKYAIEVKGLHVRNERGKPILLSVSFNVEVGKITYIAGPSGIGKSTLINVVSGLLHPNQVQGQVRVLKRDLYEARSRPEDLQALRREMGVMYQSGALFQSMTLLENVMFPLLAQGPPREDARQISHKEAMETWREDVRRRALNALKLVRLDEWEDSRPATLSGGQRKRGGLARAIVTDWSLLLCDEPCSGLDPAMAAEIDVVLHELYQQDPRRTIVVVSHDLASINKVAHNIIFLGREPGSGLFFVKDGTKDDYMSWKHQLIKAFRDRTPVSAAPAEETDHR